MISILDENLTVTWIQIVQIEVTTMDEKAFHISYLLKFESLDMVPTIQQ